MFHCLQYNFCLRSYLLLRNVVLRLSLQKIVIYTSHSDLSEAGTGSSWKCSTFDYLRFVPSFRMTEWLFLTHIGHTYVSYYQNVHPSFLIIFYFPTLFAPFFHPSCQIRLQFFLISNHRHDFLFVSHHFCDVLLISYRLRGGCRISPLLSHDRLTGQQFSFTTVDSHYLPTIVPKCT